MPPPSVLAARHGEPPCTAGTWHLELCRWLTDLALPRWWEQGTDHRNGGFFEKIGLTGEVIDEPRRTRVTARQIYVFSVVAVSLKKGPALAAVEHGVDFLLTRQRRPDGTFASAVTVDGQVVDDRFDLYEQAFALFSLAAAHRVTPGKAPQTRLRQAAEGLFLCLSDRWKHPLAGFQESHPPSVPLRSNPHMHLLEAVMAWSQLGSADERASWRARGQELVQLCLNRLLDPLTGAVREYFDADWAPMPQPRGRIIEPGHQFEWAWLLMQWQALHGPQSGGTDAAERLVATGERHGVNAHGVAVNELLDDFSVHDAGAKLWPQTERVKAWMAMTAVAHARGGDSDLPRRKVAEACEGLAHYIRHAPPGLWHELMLPDGSMAAQPCRASSLYHIVCAIKNLHDHRALIA